MTDHSDAAEATGRPPSTDAQDRAEELDDTTIRLDQSGRSDGGLPGVNHTTGSEPMHAEDPNLLLGGSETRDEMHTRTWRERPDAIDDADRQDEESDDVQRALDLVEAEGAERRGVDIEGTSIADTAGGHRGGTPVPAEVDAITTDRSDR